MTGSNQEPTRPRSADVADTEREGRIAELLRESREGFEPGFVDRAMGRLDEERDREVDLPRVMRRQFGRWAPLGLAAGLALAAFNLSRAGEESQGTIEALLGLEPVTLSSAYSIALPSMSETGVQP